MSSFAVKEGLEDAIRYWPCHSVPCELYAFMHSDCAKALKRYGCKSGDTNRTTAENMAAAWRQAQKVPLRERRAERAAWMADWLPPRLHRPTGKPDPLPPLQVFALASFLPEIGSLKKEDVRTASDAIDLIFYLAAALREQGHPVDTVEIVAGSRVARVSAQPGKSGVLYSADWPPDPLPLVDNLCRNLVPVAEKALEANLRLTVELEPGPLYILNDRDPLLRFCAQLKENDALSRAVGVNLDIAHWDLAGITSDWLLDQNEVSERIRHLHISDHGKGHFGDAALGDCHPPAHFLKWLRAANEIARKRRRADLPGMTGKASLELEACRNTDIVVRSLERLRFLLQLIKEGSQAPAEWPESA